MVAAATVLDFTTSSNVHYHGMYMRNTGPAMKTVWSLFVHHLISWKSNFLL